MPTIKRLLVQLTLAAWALGLAACDPAKRVEGYEDLKAGLSPAELQRLEAFDTLGAYEPVQIVLLAAVTNPDIPAEAKAAIKVADREVTAAAKAYARAVRAGFGRDAALTTFMQALQRAQVLLLEIQREGWHKRTAGGVVVVDSCGARIMEAKAWTKTNSSPGRFAASAPCSAA